MERVHVSEESGAVMVYLIFDDRGGYYFVRLLIGIFWECSSRRDEAKEFTSRALAVKTMQAAGKHKQGWRIIQDRKGGR